MFFHDSETKSGSSGSPIVLKDEEVVITIHKGDKIVDSLKNYKRNGYLKNIMTMTI